MAGEAEKILYDATKRGDMTTLQDVLEKDPYLVDGASFAYSRNLLHIASMWEQAAIVEDLLRRNPKLAEDLDSTNSSPLHIAAAKGNSQIATILIRVSPDMCWSRDCQGMNPIHIAAKNGHLEVLQHLLQLNPSPAMERLDRGQTVLHLCVKHGQLGALQFLLGGLGELVQAKDDDGETILHWAVRCNQLQIVYMLLPVAPELCWLLDSQGMNPIHIAAKNGHLEALQHLLELNPTPVMERAYRGQTVLHLCVKHGQLMVLKFLVEKYLRDVISAKDDDGETILHWAVRFNQLETVRYLVKRSNIDMLAKNSMGFSPFDVIAKLPSNRTSSQIFRILENNKHVVVNTLTQGHRTKDSMIIIVALIATVSFQSMVSPPGGVWQENSSTHEAGEATMASNRPKIYALFIAFNMTAFVTSLMVMFGVMLEHSLSPSFLMTAYVYGFNLALISAGISYGASLMVILPNRLIHELVPIFIVTILGFCVILLLTRIVWNKR